MKSGLQPRQPSRACPSSARAGIHHQQALLTLGAVDRAWLGSRPVPVGSTASANYHGGALRGVTVADGGHLGRSVIFCRADELTQ